MRKLTERIFFVLVLVMILVPALLVNTKPDQISVTENRTLAQPVLGEGADRFMTSLSSAIDDRIGLRLQMLDLFTGVMYETLDAKHPDVIMGEDGWLFYEGDMPDYCGTNISDGTIEHQLAVLTAINNWCAERGITFILAVGPNKSEIYDNCMPAGVHHTEVTKAERIVKALNEQGIHASYAKADMIAHRDERELYYKLDTHWNSYGARYMMEDMCRQLGLPIREFTYEETPVIEGDLMNMMGTGNNGVWSLQVETSVAPGASLEELYSTTHIYIHSENTEKIVCYRDSFSRVMLPMYSHYFHGNVFWDFTVDFEFVEAEQPEYLILSCVERFFDDMIAANEHALNRG